MGERAMTTDKPDVELDRTLEAVSAPNAEGWSGRDKAKAEAKSALQSMLIEAENRGGVRELQALLDDETKGATCVCQLADVGICDHNWSLCNVVRDRLKELITKQEGEK